MKCGQAQLRIGNAEREFIQTTSNDFLQPLHNFLEGDMKTIQVRQFRGHLSLPPFIYPLPQYPTLYHPYTSNDFLQPLHSFLEGDIKAIQVRQFRGHFSLPHTPLTHHSPNHTHTHIKTHLCLGLPPLPTFYPSLTLALPGTYLYPTYYTLLPSPIFINSSVFEEGTLHI